MKMKYISVQISVLVMALSAATVFAQDVAIDFTATILVPSCDIRINGGTGDNNTIAIGNGGKTSLDKILAGDSSASTPFSLEIISCSGPVSSLQTTINASQSATVSSAIDNDYSADDSAPFTGVQISRASGGKPFVINSTSDAERLVWTASEISNKRVDLKAQLISTDPAQSAPGIYRSSAQFVITYE